MNPVVEHHTVLRQSIQRDEILELLLTDLVKDSDGPSNRILDQPRWGAVYHVGAHLATKHPDYPSFFRKAGQPDYNIFHVSFDDLVEVLEQYSSLVLKTADYNTVNDKDELDNSFNHGLNDHITPPNAVETRFITVSETDHQPELEVTTVLSEATDSDGSAVNTETEQVPVHKLENVVGDATSLYFATSDVVPADTPRQRRVF